MTDDRGLDPTTTVPTIDGEVELQVRVPGSKSIANRVLACAALADGTSTVRHLPDGDDTVAMLAALRAFGLEVHEDDRRAEIVGTTRPWPTGRTTVHAGLAGTTSRFTTALAALGGDACVIDGFPPLRTRPFGPLHDALTTLGVRVTPRDGAGPGELPVEVQGPPSSGSVALPGDVSSQFVSALMLIGPFLPGGLDLTLTTDLVSRPYVELTAAVMAMFGAEGVAVSGRRIVIEPGPYRAVDVDVEPDASSASYPLALAAIHGGSATVPGLGDRSLQGDARFAGVLAAMGCTVHVGADVTTVVGPVQRGVDLDMSEISDLVPTVAVVAAFAGSPTRIRNVGFIREKESDRLGDLAAELRRVGVVIAETDDGLDLEPSVDRLVPARLGTHHDHRLAMAFGVLGTAVPGTEVVDPDVVSKSWPAFWDELAAWCAR